MSIAKGYLGGSCELHILDASKYPNNKYKFLYYMIVVENLCEMDGEGTLAALVSRSALSSM